MTALCREMANSPIAAIERTLKACPEEKESDGRPPNVGALFLQAVMQANAKPSAPGDQARVIEGEATGYGGGGGGAAAPPKADW
jgi:hypothetical protein